MSKANAENKEMWQAINANTAAINELNRKFDILALNCSKAFASSEEMGQVIQNVSVKLDCFTNGSNMVDTTPKPKRAPAKKKSAEVKDDTPQVQENAAPVEVPVQTDAPAAAPTTKRQVRKALPKKTIDEPPALNNAQPVETKTPVVKPVATRAAKPATATRQINKMEFFKQRYSEDPKYFDEYLTPAVKTAVRSEHPEWKSLSGDALVAEERKAFYSYMTKNHDKELIAMKTDWIKDQENASVEIVGKE